MYPSRLVQPSTIDRGRRKRILTALRNTEIYTAEHIVQRYLVTIGNKEVEGRQQPGSVVLSPEEDGCKIYLKEKYLEQERNPWELVQKLASFASIDNRKVYLLHVILTESNPNRIQAVLATEGVPMSYPDDDEGEADWLSARTRNMASADNAGAGLPGHMFGTETLTIITSANANLVDGNWDDLDPDGLGAGGPSLGDSPFGAGFKIVSSNGRYGQKGGGDVVDEELEFAGENFVRRKLGPFRSIPSPLCIWKKGGGGFRCVVHC